MIRYLIAFPRPAPACCYSDVIVVICILNIKVSEYMVCMNQQENKNCST